MTDKAPLVLVDGSSYLYRAFHALPSLTTSTGKPTGAVKGVINMLRRLQKDYPASTVAVVFDAKGKTFRDAIYPAYKAHRPPMPDELREQIQPIHAIINAMGLPLLIIDDVEADDVIGTLAAQATANKIDVVVSTGDKDMAQLVSEHVTLVNTMTDTTLDPDGVVQKFGMGPELIIDFLALMGDKVDNIPGVAGVGEKTALGLIQHLGGIDAIYANLDRVAEAPVRGAKKLGEKLAESEADARLSYRLATIKLDCELPVTTQQLCAGALSDAPNSNALRELFVDLEFKTWVEELADVSVTEAVDPQPVTNYETVVDEPRLKHWVAQLRKVGRFAFDTETTSLDYRQARVVGVSVSVQADEAAYIPFSHDYEGAPAQLSEQQVLGALKPLLEDAAIAKLGQNLKYDKHVIANHGITLRGIADDSMLQSYVLNSTATRHDMDSLAFAHLNHQTIKYEDVAGKGAKQVTFNGVDLKIAAPYAAEDADISLQLCDVLGKKLKAEPTLDKLYRDIELPLVSVICDIETNGALVDSDLLAKQSGELGDRMLELEKQVYELAGETFNLSSPKQLQKILFEKLGIPVVKKTPKGQPSTAEPVLQELALDYPLPKLIMEYRGLSKLKSTYTDRLPEQVSESTGRIHTSYHQAVTATGRLSSSDPNLQNIPIRTAEGRKVRQAFIAPSDFKIVAADLKPLILEALLVFLWTTQLQHLQ